MKHLSLLLLLLVASALIATSKAARPRLTFDKFLMGKTEGAHLVISIYNKDYGACVSDDDPSGCPKGRKNKRTLKFGRKPRDMAFCCPN